MKREQYLKTFKKHLKKHKDKLDKVETVMNIEVRDCPFIYFCEKKNYPKTTCNCPVECAKNGLVANCPKGKVWRDQATYYHKYSGSAKLRAEMIKIVEKVV